MKPVWGKAKYLYTYWISSFMAIHHLRHGPLNRYVNCGLRMHRECRERFPRNQIQSKLLVSDPDMHHGTCVTQVPWCMSGSLTRGGGKTFQAFPARAEPTILRNWQEADAICLTAVFMTVKINFKPCHKFKNLIEYVTIHSVYICTYLLTSSFVTPWITYI